jgi:hypothetical protein
MAKPKLKAIEPTLEGELEAAIAVEGEAQTELQKAQTAFKRKYPGEISLYLAGVTRFEDQTPIPKGVSKDLANQLSAERRLGQARDFRGDFDDLRELERAADDAGRHVRQLRVRLAESVDEKSARGRLAGAIKNAAKAATEVERLRAAVSRVDAAIKDAQEQHSKATRTVTEATERQRISREAAFEQGHPPAPDDSVRDARRAAEDASEAVAAAKAAAPGLRAKLANAESQLREANDAVAKWSGWTASTAIPRLLAEAETIRADLEGRRQALFMLADFASTEHQVAVSDFLSSCVFPFGVNGELPQDHPTCTPWLAAIAALSCDAGAPLPRD